MCLYTLAVLHPPFFQATPDAWKLGRGTRFAGEQGVHQPAAKRSGGYYLQIYDWWNGTFIFPYIGNNHPN